MKFAILSVLALLSFATSLNADAKIEKGPRVRQQEQFDARQMRLVDGAMEGYSDEVASLALNVWKFKISGPLRDTLIVSPLSQEAGYYQIETEDGYRLLDILPTRYFKYVIGPGAVVKTSLRGLLVIGMHPGIRLISHAQGALDKQAKVDTFVPTYDDAYEFSSGRSLR